MGTDLVHVLHLTEQQAKCGQHIQIPTLEGKIVNFKLASAIQSGAEIPFFGLGLPNGGTQHGRGKLIVRIEKEEEPQPLNSMQNDTPTSELVQQQQLPPNRFDLPLTLNEVLHGAIIEKVIDIEIVDNSGSKRIQTKTFPIEVKPGIEAGTEFTFPRCGSQVPGLPPADVTFTTTDEPNEVFTRKGADLHQTVKVTAKQAKRGSFKLKIPTLANGTLPVFIDKYLKQGATWELIGYGLPCADEPEERRGNLILTFDVVKNESYLI